MNYKIMIMMISFPIASYSTATERDARLKELLDIKAKTEDETVKLDYKISKARGELIRYEEDMYKLYRIPIDENDKKGLVPESFRTTIFHLSCLFDMGGDVEPFIDEAFHKKAGTDIRLMCIRLIIQQLVVDRMTNQYRTLTDKLITINKELRTLHGACPNSGSEANKSALG